MNIKQLLKHLEKMALLAEIIKKIDINDDWSIKLYTKYSDSEPIDGDDKVGENYSVDVRGKHGPQIVSPDGKKIIFCVR